MKIAISHAAFFLFVPAFFLPFVGAAAERRLTEGDVPYTPTRIEWLMTEGRNECGFLLDGLQGVSYGLFNKDGPNKTNTITVAVRFKDEKIRSDVQQAAEICARNLKGLARSQHSWNWLKIEVDVINNALHAINPKGFTLSKITTESSFGQMGLRDGDLIKTINFKPVSSYADAIKLQELLKSKTAIRVEFVRDGSTQVKIFDQ